MVQSVLCLRRECPKGRLLPSLLISPFLMYRTSWDCLGTCHYKRVSPRGQVTRVHRRVSPPIIWDFLVLAPFPFLSSYKVVTLHVCVPRSPSFVVFLILLVPHDGSVPLPRTSSHPSQLRCLYLFLTFMRLYSWSRRLDAPQWFPEIRRRTTRF